MMTEYSPRNLPLLVQPLVGSNTDEDSAFVRTFRLFPLDMQEQAMLEGQLKISNTRNGVGKWKKKNERANEL
jgi:hypothetical protein